MREFLPFALMCVNLCLLEIIIQTKLHQKQSISISSLLLLKDDVEARFTHRKLPKSAHLLLKMHRFIRQKKQLETRS